MQAEILSKKTGFLVLVLGLAPFRAHYGLSISTSQFAPLSLLKPDFDLHFYVPKV